MKFERIQYMLRKNSVVKRDVDHRIISAEKNRVNLNAWVDPTRDIQNVGDWLSEIIVNEVTNYWFFRNYP